jgi:hypothetical protein
VSAAKPSAAELQRQRLERAATRRTDPGAEPAGSSAIRSKPVRVTVDLTPAQYRRLNAWIAETAADIDVVKLSQADVVRAFVMSLGRPDVDKALRIALSQLKTG